MPCVSREALPGERLALLLGAPHQQVAPGRVAEGANQGPCGDPAATEGERVVEGATAERQVRGTVDPAHPQRARGVGSLPACAGRRRTRHTPRNAVGRPQCLLLLRRPRQTSCQNAGGLRREGEPHKSRCDERDGRGGEEKWARKPRKYRSHLAWSATRSRLSKRTTDLVLSQGGSTIANLVRCKVGNLGRPFSSPLGAQRCGNLVRAHVLPSASEDFDTVNAMTNLLVHTVRKMDLSSWLPLRDSAAGPTTPTTPRRSVDGCRVSSTRRRRRSSWASPTGVPSPTMNTRNPRVG